MTWGAFTLGGVEVTPGERLLVQLAGCWFLGTVEYQYGTWSPWRIAVDHGGGTISLTAGLRARRWRDAAEDAFVVLEVVGGALHRMLVRSSRDDAVRVAQELACDRTEAEDRTIVVHHCKVDGVGVEDGSGMVWACRQEGVKA